MNKDESIKDKEQMARIIAFELCPQKYHKEWYGEYARCYADNNYPDCAKIKKVVDKLYNEKYRKLVEGEIVVKESEYVDMELFESAIRARNDYYLKYEKAKQETAREILQEFLKEFVVYACVGDYYTSTEIYNKIQELAKKHGIELED